MFLSRQAVEIGFARSSIRRRIDRRVWEAGRAAGVPLIGVSSGRLASADHGLTLVTDGVVCGNDRGGALRPRHAPAVARRRSRRARRGVALHAVGAHHRRSSRRATSPRSRGFPRPTPARTLIDLGGTVPIARFEDLLDTAIVQRLVRVDRLRERATELWAPRRRGCAVVLSLLEARHPELPVPRTSGRRRCCASCADLDYRTRRQPSGAGRRAAPLPRPGVAGSEGRGRVRRVRAALHASRVRRRPRPSERARLDDWTVFRITKTMLDGDRGPRRSRPVAAEVCAPFDRMRRKPRKCGGGGCGLR